MIFMKGSFHTYSFFPSCLYMCYTTCSSKRQIWDTGCRTLYLLDEISLNLPSPSSVPRQEFASHRQGYCNKLVMQIRENCGVVCRQLTGVINLPLILRQPIPPPAVNTSLFHTAVPKLIVMFFCAQLCKTRRSLLMQNVELQPTKMKI